MVEPGQVILLLQDTIYDTQMEDSISLHILDYSRTPCAEYSLEYKGARELAVRKLVIIFSIRHGRLRVKDLAVRNTELTTLSSDATWGSGLRANCSYQDVHHLLSC